MRAAPNYKRHPGWGTENSFKCLDCEKECNEVGGTIQATGAPPFVRMAVCRSCFGRVNSNKAHRRKVQKKAGEIAFLAINQRIADVIGVPSRNLRAAIGHAAGADAQIDQGLGLAPGTFSRALDSVMYGGMPR